jgi:uncharacterized OB-fold protein
MSDHAHSGSSTFPDERYTLPFWEGLADGRLLVHRCESGCGRAFFPPGPVCPHCGSRAVDWAEVDPRGELYSYTRQHVTPPGFDAPLVVGLTELAAGPRLLTPVAAGYEDLAVGAPVEVAPAEPPGDVDRGDLAEYPYLEAVPVEPE